MIGLGLVGQGNSEDVGRCVEVHNSLSLISLGLGDGVGSRCGGSGDTHKLSLVLLGAGVVGLYVMMSLISFVV